MNTLWKFKNADSWLKYRAFNILIYIEFAAIPMGGAIERTHSIAKYHVAFSIAPPIGITANSI